MRTELKTLCERFIENRDIIKSAFFWNNAYLYPVCAAMFTDKGQRADGDRMKVCKQMLNQQTGLFSTFRSTAQLAMITMLAVDGYPEAKLRRVLEVYDRLKEHFFASDFLPVTAMILADLAHPARYGEVAARTRRIYELMKSEHPFLTSGEDSVFAGLLALSELTDQQVVDQVERCYQILKPEFFSGNAVQSLSHVLALSPGTAGEKCGRVLELYHGLLQRGYKYSTDSALATLGVLAMLPVSLTQVMDDLAAVDGFLSGQKGYGFFGIGRKQRLMHAGMLVCSAYIGQTNDKAMDAAAISGTISLIAAQQAAMCAAIAASSAAAANAGN